MKGMMFILIGVIIVSVHLTCIPPNAGAEPAGAGIQSMPPMSEMVEIFYKTTGLFSFFFSPDSRWIDGIGRLIMIGIGLILLYLAIRKQFEPLLLVPIGFGAILTNIPLAGMNDPGGILYYIYTIGIMSGAFPLIIFMGLGALTAFGPMLANPKTALLGAAP